MDIESIRGKLLVGTLSTSQQVKFGKTGNGKPILQVTPFDKNLPPFCMTYGGKLTGNIVVVFKFKEITKTKGSGNLPFAELVHVIGNATDENLSDSLIYHYEINRKKFMNNNETNSKEKDIVRKDLTHLNIFSIDPEGCVDIDDALSIEKINDDTYNVGVHIAQPICWLSKEDIISRSKVAFSTLYPGDENNIQLWNDEIMMKSSLLVNEKKPAYSIIFTIKNNTITNAESFPSFIINKLNTSYEKINFPQIKMLNTITNDIDNASHDSHTMVAFWMTEANKYIGKTFKNIPFRYQNQKDFSDLNDEITKVFKDLIKESASYSLNENYHTSLETFNYVHFTSPIRRIIDTIIHYKITYNDNIMEEINLDIINNFDKKTKKYHNQLKLNTTIKNMNDCEIDGWIYEKKNTKLKVYFKEIGLVSVKLINEKLAYLFDEKTLDNYVIGQAYKFKLYKKPGFLPKQKILIIPSLKI